MSGLQSEVKIKELITHPIFDSPYILLCRYCCKTQPMYRPQQADSFVDNLPPILPVGRLVGNKVEHRGAELTKAIIDIFPPIEGSTSSQRVTLEM